MGSPNEQLDHGTSQIAGTVGEDPSSEIDLRAAIVACAAGELGMVVSSDPGGDDPETGRPLRLGHERLEAYFEAAFGEAGPGAYEIQSPRFIDSGEGPPHGLVEWCGIFALWCLKASGALPNHTWKLGLGIRPRLHTTQDPQPGDIGYISDNQHHCIVEEVDDDIIRSIDGNVGGNGSILRRERRRDEFALFFKVT